ncbi:MAG: histidinol dehydrogenase [Actinomycetia bacterium]|jgi:histidinol dehydrogenase|nr:histidinol dehydrogenase [Actinomycetes bacterium]
MLTRIDVRGARTDLRSALRRTSPSTDDIAAVVRDLIESVRVDGDAAVRDLTERFDGCRLDQFALSRADLDAALAGIDPDVRAALEFARDQILAWHEAQREREAKHERAGVEVRELIVPVDRAGCYVPGGRASYPSSVLMTAVPARVAGVTEVVVCVPADKHGNVAPVTLAAAALAGVDEVYRVGGAQAIAALAYGTESIRPVDVVVGPGNAYVAEAKRQLAGVVGIDSIAGSSELAVVADETSDPVYVAADLLAQAEHGPGGAAILVTWVPQVVEAVETALDVLLTSSPRRDDAAATLSTGGQAILVDGPEQAIDATNAIAPEHLQLMCADAGVLVPLVRHAAAVFVGPYASAVVGDYVAGVNHVLPTGGTARYASALRVADFQKHVHVVTLGRDALRHVAPYAIVLAEAEGLDAHAQALRLRVEEQ